MGSVGDGVVAPPDSNGGIVGGGVEFAVFGGNDGVDGTGMGGDGLDAFEVGESPYFDGLV